MALPSVTCCTPSWGLLFKFVLSYIDDTFIFSSNMHEHLEHLEEVFARFRKAKLKLYPAKCQFMVKSVVILGHVISSEGMAPDPSRVITMKEFPPPKNVKMLRQYLGPTMRDTLHWLPVPQRVTYKLCLLTYKTIHSKAPKYLIELCEPVAESEARRRLRSASTEDLFVRKQLHCSLIEHLLAPDHGRGTVCHRN